MTQKQVFIHWKIEAVTIIFIVICISTSLYLALLSFQTLDQNLSKQLVTFAVSFLIAGMTIFAVLTVHLSIKKAFQRTGDVVESEDTAPTNDED